MNTQSRNVRISFWHRGWLRWLLAFVLLSLIHLPLFFLELPAPNSLQNAGKKEFPPVVNLALGTQMWESRQIANFLQDLHRWAEIADPRLSILPNLKTGFSKYANPLIDYPSPELPHWKLPFDFWPHHYDEHHSEVVVKDVPLAEIIWREWNRKTEINLPAKPKNVLPVGDFWTQVGVGPLQEKPQLRPPNWYEEAEFLAEREHLQGATILEVSVLPHPEPQWPSPAARPLPRVLVRQSSGSRKLDDLAVQGIHAFIAQQRSENRTADKKTRNDGGSWLLKIDWRFPSQPERDRPEQNDGGQK